MILNLPVNNEISEDEPVNNVMHRLAVGALLDEFDELDQEKQQLEMIRENLSLVRHGLASEDCNEVVLEFLNGSDNSLTSLADTDISDMESLTEDVRSQMEEEIDHRLEICEEGLKQAFRKILNLLVPIWKKLEKEHKRFKKMDEITGVTNKIKVHALWADKKRFTSLRGVLSAAIENGKKLVDGILHDLRNHRTMSPQELVDVVNKYYPQLQKIAKAIPGIEYNGVREVDVLKNKLELDDDDIREGSYRTNTGKKTNTTPEEIGIVGVKSALSALDDMLVIQRDLRLLNEALSEFYAIHQYIRQPKKHYTTKENELIEEVDKKLFDFFSLFSEELSILLFPRYSRDLLNATIVLDKKK